MFETLEMYFPNAMAIFSLVIFLSLLESVLKGIALWKAGRNNDLGWFVFLFIFNTAGILPAIYLILKRDKKTV